MKTLTIICNVILLLFTLMVLVTDGASAEPPYIVLTLLLLTVPALNVVALVGRKAALARAAAGANVVLLAFVCWALVDQYPHPEEAGFIPYVIATLATPLLSAGVLMVGGRKTPAPALG